MLSSPALLLLSALGLATPAGAPPSPPLSFPAPAAVADTASAVAPPRPLPRLSLTFSPIHLAVPMGLVTGEVRVRDKLGVAVLAGIGWVTQTSPGITTHFRLFEVGTQVRYYVLGTFRHGLQLGAEAAYFHLSSPFARQLAATADAVAVGPFVGYKIATEVGLTFEAQLGYQHLWARGEENGAAAARNESSSVLFHLNVGWSFWR